MPAPWAGGAEVRIVGELHGSACINVFHMATNNQIFDDPSNLDQLLLQLAEAMLECAIQTLLPGVTSEYELIRVEAKRIYPAPSDPIIATAPANSVGARGPTSVSFASSLLNVRTGIGGRRGRGRKFLPPPGEDDVTASALDEDVLLLITQFALCVAGKFMGPNPTTDWVYGILSKTDLGGVLGNFNNAFRVAVSLNPVADQAIMSSRRKGRGA